MKLVQLKMSKFQTVLDGAPPQTAANFTSAGMLDTLGAENNSKKFQIVSFMEKTPRNNLTAIKMGTPD